MIGSRFYVKAVSTITYKGQSEFNNGFALKEEQKKGMDAAQVIGATSSYARKYALSGLVMNDDVKDADSQSGAAESQKQPTKQPPKQAAPKIQMPDNEYNELGEAIINAASMDALKK